MLPEPYRYEHAYQNQKMIPSFQMQNLTSDISFEWLLEFLLTMLFFVQNSIHIEEGSITRLSNLCQTEPINYTVCSGLLYVFVGDIPLHIDIRETADSGKPIVVSQPDCLQVQCTTPDIVLKQHQANS